jgi:tocopherol cyclase
MTSRNGYMLKGALAKHGYDWWWHSFLAEDEETGDLVPFFIEYFIINPAAGTSSPVFGQIPGKPAKPSYAMIKAGKWGKDKCQIHNFWPVSDFMASRGKMDIVIGTNTADDHRLTGSVSLSPAEAAAHPEYMSDGGTLSWDLSVEKELSFNVGYGASRFFRALNAFQMFWHAEGMKTRFEGYLTHNGKRYRVRRESSCGYQDKNWGSDFTSPWIWLNCNRFTDERGQALENTSLAIGGGNPRIFGISLGEKVLASFYHEGINHEFNFSRILFQKQKWECSEDSSRIRWKLNLENRTHRLNVLFSCPKEGMLLINYENPAGEKNHTRLWNGGYASGTVELSEKKGRGRTAFMNGTHGGCEYGRA